MRVLLDLRMASWSGVGRYSTGLARALASREDVSLVCVTSSGEVPVVPSGPRVQIVPANSHPFSPGGMREIAHFARMHTPDVTHALHFPTPLPAPHPLVVTLQDLTPLLVDGAMPSAVRRAVYKRLNVRASRAADRIIAPSRNTAADVERLLPAARGKVRVILDAADDFSAGPLGALPGGLVPPGVRYIFTMGNTKPHKDLPTLLAAFARLAETNPDLHLLLAGAGDPAYLVARLPETLWSRAKFTGRIGDPELRALYVGAAAFAFPSTYEGFGLPPLEAMALGTPTVVADASSLPEVVGDAAVLVAPRDPEALAAAIESVLGDRALRDALVARGHARAAELTWAATADATVAVYREAIAGA
jgi:glycosyltransferase involved in cell wall biosynthesis